MQSRALRCDVGGELLLQNGRTEYRCIETVHRYRYVKGDRPDTIYQRTPVPMHGQHPRNEHVECSIDSCSRLEGYFVSIAQLFWCFRASCSPRNRISINLTIVCAKDQVPIVAFPPEPTCSPPQRGLKCWGHIVSPKDGLLPRVPMEHRRSMLPLAGKYLGALRSPSGLAPL